MEAADLINRDVDVIGRGREALRPQEAVPVITEVEKTFNVDEFTVVGLVGVGHRFAEALALLAVAVATVATVVAPVGVIAKVTGLAFALALVVLSRALIILVRSVVRTLSV